MAATVKNKVPGKMTHKEGKVLARINCKVENENALCMRSYLFSIVDLAVCFSLLSLSSSQKPLLTLLLFLFSHPNPSFLLSLPPLSSQLLFSL